MAEVLPIRRKTLSDQSINQSKPNATVVWLKYCRYDVKHYPINQTESINQSLMCVC